MINETMYGLGSKSSVIRELFAYGLELSLIHIQILGNGELTKKLTVQANAFSASAAAKIEALGGKAEVI